MAKKKKKRSAKKRAQKKAEAFRRSTHVAGGSPNTNPNRAVLPIHNPPDKTETTFSKKLEKEIADLENKTKKGFFKNHIILLSAPKDYLEMNGKRIWKAVIRDLFKTLIIFLIIAGSTSAVIVLEILSDGRVFPRTKLAQHDLGYVNVNDAKAYLLEQLQQYQEKSLSFSYEDKLVTIPLKELPIKLQTDETLLRLLSFNFPKNNFINLLQASFSEHQIIPVFQKDDLKVFRLIESKLGLQNQRAKSAHFQFNDQKKLVITPESEGIIIDQSKLLNALNKRLNQLDVSPISVETLRELPQVSAGELEKFQSDLQVKLENQITIKYANKTWKFKATDHLAEIDFRNENDSVIIATTPNLVEGFFNKEIFSKIEKPVSDLKIFYNDQDKVIFEGKAQDGLEVKKHQFISDFEMAINSLDQEVEIFTENKPAAVEIDQRLQDQGIKELIGVGHTAFAGSPPNRRHNVATGMAKFEGLIIKPGETFSFNKNLGEVDGSTGYKLELVIKAEGTLPEYGGGICQVSSTFFKAALLSGLPIVERKPHSYAVGYYAQIDGYGLDSTIYPGVVDLKFTNNTPASILIQPYIDGDDAYVNFFGTSDGRQVKLENYWRGNFRSSGSTQLIPTTTLPPGARKQIESAHGGFDTSWERVIIKEGQEIRDKINSAYRATSNRILVGEE
jgi:vancomycin resistance protein YoaR